MPKVKNCEVCGALFAYERETAKYCSPFCRGRASGARQKAFGYVAAKRKPLLTKKCSECGREFQTSISSQIQCGREECRLSRIARNKKVAANQPGREIKRVGLGIIVVPGADVTTRHPEVCPMDTMAEWTAEDPKEAA